MGQLLCSGPDRDRDSITSMSCNPGAEYAGLKSQQIRMLDALQRVTIDGINSQAQIDNWLIDAELAHLDAEAVAHEIRAAELALEQIATEVTQLISQYRQAHDNFSEAYFNNPAYRLARDDAIGLADEGLHLAQTATYRFARRLEYEWSEIFDPTALPSTFPGRDRVPSIPEVFQTVNPFQVELLLNALKEWDLVLRNLRDGGVVMHDYDSRLSFRQHVLGLNDYNEQRELLPLNDPSQPLGVSASLHGPSHRLTESLPGFPILDPETLRCCCGSRSTCCRPDSRGTYF